jgi:Tol biopolymer transport system component/DNA-binding winged helix-turn-helix (wHTH) protein
MAVIGDNGTRTIRFGIFELDLHAAELRRNGFRVKLQEQPFQILTLLLDRSGEVVTREELQKKLWPADTFVDFDHSLNAAIRRLRDALGDSAENPRFVETVARRGYRFLIPVNGAPTAAPAVPIPVPESRQFDTTKVRPKKWLIFVAAALLLAGVTAGLFVSRPSAHPLQFKQRRLTANPEDDLVAGAAISPDGKYLAFSDSTGFYLREIDGGETHPLSVSKVISAVPAAWYPDGTHLIAKGVEGPQSAPSLWEISIVGGSARKLIDNAMSPALSPDGSQILFVRSPSTGQEIWVMQVDGEKPTRLVAANHAMFVTPAWSPDGRKIVYVTGHYEPKHWQTRLWIEIFDCATGHKETILPATDLRSGLAWTSDDQLIYAVSEPPPNQADSNLWAVQLNRSGHVVGAPARLTVSDGDVAAITASLDGKRIAYTKHSLQPDVYVAELNPAGTRLNTHQRLTLDERNDFPFAWTRDSKTVLFTSDRDGVYHIYKQAIDLSVPERIARGDEQAMGAARLTPDGLTVLYVIWPKVGESPAPGGLMRVPLAGGPPEVLIKQNGIGNVQCTSLPAAFCLYDLRSTDQMSFFRFDPVTGASQELPQLKIQGEPSYGYNWSLSPDGKTLATSKRESWTMGDYSSMRAPTINYVSMADGSRRTVTVPAWAGINSVDWAVDGRGVWAPAYTNTGTWALLKVDLQGRTTTVLEDTKMTIGWAIPAPDGKHLALWKAGGSSNVWMLERY